MPGRPRPATSFPCAANPQVLGTRQENKALTEVLSSVDVRRRGADRDRLWIALITAASNHDVRKMTSRSRATEHRRLVSIVNQATRLKAGLLSKEVALLAYQFPKREGLPAPKTHHQDSDEIGASSFDGLLKSLDLLIGEAMAQAKHAGQFEAGTQTHTPLEALIGYDLPAVAERLLGIDSRFSRSVEGVPQGRIITFIMGALPLLKIADRPSAETIGSYISSARQKPAPWGSDHRLERAFNSDFESN